MCFKRNSYCTKSFLLEKLAYQLWYSFWRVGSNVCYKNMLRSWAKALESIWHCVFYLIVFFVCFKSLNLHDTGKLASRAILRKSFPVPWLRDKSFHLLWEKSLSTESIWSKSFCQLLKEEKSTRLWFYVLSPIFCLRLIQFSCFQISTMVSHFKHMLGTSFEEH